MKETKGFTLIELLAVIVILAIIALIATPMILGVIETAKKGATESSALGYIDAIEKQVSINELDDINAAINDGVYEISELNDTKYGITIKGDIPDSGWILIKNGVVTNYSFVIDEYVVTKGKDTKKSSIAATKPSDTICIRAKELHTETCDRTDSVGCNATYENGSIITYGNLEKEENKLTSGDAFDCDVNDDGTYDDKTERFYYVTDLSSDDKYAVLIYYNNTSVNSDGIVIPDNTTKSLIQYYSQSRENWHGPVTAIKNLPTTKQWSKVKLSTNVRQIISHTGATQIGSYNLPSNFEYKNDNNEEYATRLLTYQEVVKGCNLKSSAVIGELDECNYLLENTKYSSKLMGTYSYWLETPSASSSLSWFVFGSNRQLNGSYTDLATDSGVRPAIEVLKEKIEY